MYLLYLSTTFNFCRNTLVYSNIQKLFFTCWWYTNAEYHQYTGTCFHITNAFFLHVQCTPKLTILLSNIYGVFFIKVIVAWTIGALQMFLEGRNFVLHLMDLLHVKYMGSSKFFASYQRHIAHYWCKNISFLNVNSQNFVKWKSWYFFQKCKTRSIFKV